MNQLVSIDPPVGSSSSPGAVLPLTVLVVDDEPHVRLTLTRILERRANVLEAADGTAALDAVSRQVVDVVVLDILLPDQNGIEVLRAIKTMDASIEVIPVTAVKDVQTAVQAMKLGAAHYLTKPFDVEELRALVMSSAERRALAREVLALRSEIAYLHGFEALVGQHPSMGKVFELVARIAPTPSTVLIQGESGTGKELVARAIHRRSPRASGPFVAVNVAAVPETLLEAELFGHERGAFTGANARRAGRFELAHGGTLFLDEVASLRVDLQAKLLRVLQEREVERLGGRQAIKVDIRLLAATNRDLKQAVASGEFREDLYYRLDVIPIVIPPLRERREDIPALVTHFLGKFAAQLGSVVREVSPEALAALMGYSWPGNVRELENIVQRCVVLARSPVIDLDDLPSDLASNPGVRSAAPAQTLKEAVDRFEVQLIRAALEAEGWKYSKAAHRLGIHRNTLLNKITAFKINPPRQDSHS